MNVFNDPLDTEFDNLVNDTIANWHVPGLSIAVVSGEEVFAKVCNTPTISIALQLTK